MLHPIILFLFGLTLMTVSPVFAQEDTVKTRTSDDGSASSPRLSVTTSTGENSLDMPDLHIDPNTEQIKTAPDAGENSLELEEDSLVLEEIGVVESEKDRAGEPLLGNEKPSVSEPTHLNERILQLQKAQSKELDKSLDTPTEDDGY